jgi:hypothetical protein
MALRLLQTVSLKRTKNEIARTKQYCPDPTDHSAPDLPESTVTFPREAQWLTLLMNPRDTA